MKWAVLISAVVFAAGCTTVSQNAGRQAPAPGGAPAEVRLSSAFNPDDVLWVQKRGAARVAGQAYMTLNDGGRITCAGAGVSLLPKAAYSEERMSYLYHPAKWNAATRQSRSDEFPNGVNFLPQDSRYYAYQLKSKCNADGFFEFSNVPAGSYFLTTAVSWRSGAVQYGGPMMQEVEVTDGDVLNVELAVKAGI